MAMLTLKLVQLICAHMYLGYNQERGVHYSIIMGNYTGSKDVVTWMRDSHCRQCHMRFLDSKKSGDVVSCTQLRGNYTLMPEWRTSCNRLGFLVAMSVLAIGSMEMSLHLMPHWKSH